MVFFFVAKFLHIDDLRKGKEREYLVANYLFFLGKQFCRLLDKKVLFWMKIFNHISIEFLVWGSSFLLFGHS